MDDTILPPRNAVVGVFLANCDVANDTGANLYVREKPQSGSLVPSAVSFMVHVCKLFKHNDCDIELKK